MGAHERRKGADGGRDLVGELRAAGIAAERVAPLEAGGIARGDVRDGQGHVWQAKRRARVHLYDWLDGYDRLAVRADRKGWLVVMTLDHYLDLVAGGPASEGSAVAGDDRATP